MTSPGRQEVEGLSFAQASPLSSTAAWVLVTTSGDDDLNEHSCQPFGGQLDIHPQEHQRHRQERSRCSDGEVTDLARVQSSSMSRCDQQRVDDDGGDEAGVDVCADRIRMWLLSEHRTTQISGDRLHSGARVVTTGPIRASKRRRRELEHRTSTPPSPCRRASASRQADWWCWGIAGPHRAKRLWATESPSRGPQRNGVGRHRTASQVSRRTVLVVDWISQVENPSPYRLIPR